MLELFSEAHWSYRLLAWLQVMEDSCSLGSCGHSVSDNICLEQDLYL